MMIDAVCADILIGTEHVVLFSEHSALGIQASVYNARGKKWIAPSEPVSDIEEGKEKAARYAILYLKSMCNLDLPALNWKHARS